MTKTRPLENRVKLPLRRSDFVSDEAHKKYLNGIAGLVFMQFLHSRDAEIAMVEKTKKPDRSAGAGAEALAFTIHPTDP